LLKTEGKSWQFQVLSVLKNLLQNALEDYYNQFQLKNIDKTTIPIYLFLADAETGKSRIATELPLLAKKCVNTHPELMLWAKLIQFANRPIRNKAKLISPKN